MKGFVLTKLAIVLFLIIGEIMCIVKVFKCNWEPVGKAEVIYTASAFTGLGGLVGWLKIEDK